jgi:hypothetical protein
MRLNDLVVLLLLYVIGTSVIVLLMRFYRWAAGL